jgi:hypothetical protein
MMNDNPLGAPQAILARHGHDQLPHLRAELWTATSGAGLPAPEQPPSLPMPAHHRIWRDHPQVLAPAGAEPTSQDPHQLVPEVQASTRPGSSGAGQERELVAQEQVLKHEVVARARPGQDGREQQPEEFEHASRITDRRSREVLPSHNS